MSIDNRTELNDCDAATGWTGDGPSPAVTTLTGYRYEGTGAIESQHSNSDEQMNTTSIGGTRNLATSTVYMLLKDNLVDTYANGGIQFVLGDGTRLIGYDMAGNDAVGMPVTPFYNCYKLDVAEVVATPGAFTAYSGGEDALVHTAITQVGVGTLHLAKAQGNVTNIFIDRMTFHANTAYALTINGGTVGTPETMADVQGDDETNGWGMVANPLGSQFIIFASTEWGTPSGTADSYFEGTDEQWYFVGDNGGGRQMVAGNFIFRLIGNATGTNSFVLTRVTMVSTGTRAIFDLSNANMDAVRLDGCVFTDFAALTFPDGGAAADFFCNNAVFNNCDQMDWQALTMDGCIVNGTTDANGAILWDEGTTDPAAQDNITFNSDGTGHAIEIAPTGAGPFTYNITGYTFDGYAGQSGTSTDRVFYINPVTATANITINLTDSTALNVVGGGSGFSWRERTGYTGTVTIQTTVNLNVQVNDASGNGIEGARIRIETNPGGTLISQGETTGGSGGAYSDSYNFGGDQAVLIKVRLKGYKPFRTTGTITSNGLTVVATLQDDKIVDLP